jgi:hypothetical protein
LKITISIHNISIKIFLESVTGTGIAFDAKNAKLLNFEKETLIRSDGVVYFIFY